jgi:hypothetical protein
MGCSGGKLPLAVRCIGMTDDDGCFLLAEVDMNWVAEICRMGIKPTTARLSDLDDAADGSGKEVAGDLDGKEGEVEEYEGWYYEW